jgi:hypothetical protein
VIIAFDYHAQFNRNIYYILVCTSTCAFPILLDYSLWLYYLALHYFFTRGCDYLIGKCRDTLSVFITEYRLPNAQLYSLIRVKNGHPVSRVTLLPRLLYSRSRPKIYIPKWRPRTPLQAIARSLKYTRHSAVYTCGPMRKEEIGVI